uniref:Cystatin domain-containing protein n=1 Tax=Anguilla anguilla TaxID=7936 RepID=A0A0E9Q713_ANGAN
MQLSFSIGVTLLAIVLGQGKEYKKTFESCRQKNPSCQKHNRTALRIVGKYMVVQIIYTYFIFKRDMKVVVVGKDLFFKTEHRLYVVCT